MRVFHAVLLVSVLVFAFLGEFLGPQAGKLDPTFDIALAIVATASAAIAFFFRRGLSASALEELQRDPKSQAALMRWRTAQVTSMVLVQSIALFGFALRFLGTPAPRVAPYYVGSILLLLYFRPSEPSA